VGEQIQGADCK